MRQLYLLCFIFFGIQTTSAQFLSTKKDLQTFNGYFSFHYAESEGNIYLEVPKDKIDEEFLYVHSLRTGLGSNDIGLDRGQLGGQAVVTFIKSGNKLLLLQPNQNYRAISNNELERKSINEAFAKSVLYGFEIKETKSNSFVIDFTPFLMQDTHGVARRLKAKKEGTYKLDKTRNTVWMERTKSFPKNTEFEAMLTFVGAPTGRNVRAVAPDASALTVIQHHSFVALPDANFEPRQFHPGSGSNAMTYLDYSTPIWEPIRKRFIMKHRLEKKNPNAAMSEAKEPIIYYLDPGTPEPVRSALLEGASWWNQAFESAGYTNAFQVKMLPADADPMDVRYNVIQWVHRSTRGWSYGGSVSDPRTGEIIKGHVSLGSLRIRQDFMIAQALMNQPFAERDDNYQPMLEMALARIRQLSAHEVGHTLGFAHNFAASADGRKSVMDYPHPTLQLKNGVVDFSNAYATGIGAWEKVTVNYSYSAIPNGADETSYLNGILRAAQQQGLHYISDSDARPQSGAHEKAHLWDNGENAASELQNMLALRKHAIENFSEDNIRTGEAYSVLEDVFVPLYFYHRFQTEAAVKLIGGLDYTYAVKGDGQTIVKTTDSKTQHDAVRAIMNTLDSETLAIPEDKLALFPPRAFGYNRGRESFKSNNGVSFDALGAAETASDMTLGLLLNPQRANRLVHQKALDPKNLGLSAVLSELFDAKFLSMRRKNDYYIEIDRVVRYRVLQHLFNLAVHGQSIPQTKAIAIGTINDIYDLSKKEQNDHAKYMMHQIDAFKAKPELFKIMATPKIPDGSPIGTDACMYGSYE